MHTRLKRSVLGMGAGILLGTALLFGSFHAIPLPERIDVDGSAVMYWGDEQPAHVFLSPDEKWRIRVTLDEVDPTYVAALIRLEDRRFRSHLGVDPVAILRALISNVTRGRVVSGASTITMQVVRVLEPRPRTLRSKVIEAWRALQLEWYFTKDEILETYVNHVPFGRNVEGLEAASLAYFGHRASALSPDEVATLLTVPQNPNRRYPHPGNEVRLTEGRNEIARYLLQEEAMDLGHDADQVDAEALLEQILTTPVPDSLTRLPREVPHMAYALKERFPNQQRFYTTLHRGTQKMVERHMRAAQRSLSQQDIHHGVAIVVDHETGEVRGLVGNFDFWGSESGDQIAMHQQPRSPGSTLKPFIYALAIDEGLMLPEHLVLDIPAIYRGYTPKNYDGTFSGLVSVEDALSRSLNLPFVFLLQKLGVESFIGHLGMMGVESLHATPGYYGLSVAAGGLEMTPMELMGLYAALAQDGQYRPVRWRKDQEAVRPMRVLSEGASWLTRRALALKDRPDFPSRRSMNQMPASIHWKTGTSFGHKDAWAVGSGPQYTALVWLGNANQQSARALVGADASGPILFDILESVGREHSAVVPPPSDLTEVSVCRYSGFLAQDSCPHAHDVWALSHQVPTKSCPFHVSIEVDQETGEAVRPGCRANRKTEVEAFVQWPASVRRWLGDEHRRIPEIPRYAAECDAPSADSGPRILSPQAGQIALLLRGVAAENQEIPLEADTASTGTIMWFVNGTYLGETDSDERMWWVPEIGTHEVVAMDDNGASSTRTFEVREKL